MALNFSTFSTGPSKNLSKALSRWTLFISMVSPMLEFPHFLNGALFLTPYLSGQSSNSLPSLRPRLAIPLLTPVVSALCFCITLCSVPLKQDHDVSLCSRSWEYLFTAGLWLLGHFKQSLLLSAIWNMSSYTFSLMRYLMSKTNSPHTTLTCV